MIMTNAAASYILSSLSTSGVKPGQVIIMEKCTHIILLGAVYNYQQFTEWTKHALSQTPSPSTLPPQNVYTSTFFKWIICHENDKKIH